MPDWVVTIDPHPTRIVRWFGDTNFEEHCNDDYWARQADFDPRFRAAGAAENEENIKTVDENPVKLVICTSAPENVVERTSAFDRYWVTPLVDPPVVGSLTRRIFEATKAPALNTGGTVGTAAWNFARSALGSGEVAVVGMDFGYPIGTPLDKTQEWNMLKEEENVADFYPVRNGHWGAAFTSPTYAWYLQNFLDLLAENGDTVTNCSGGGLLCGANVRCCELEEWLDASSGGT